MLNITKKDYKNEDIKGIIYIGVNKINGKIYVGQTIATLKNRTYQHKKRSRAKNRLGYTSKFNNALRKYGFENFKWEVLFFEIPRKYLNEYEIWAINFYSSYKYGYNSTIGGNLSPMKHPLIKEKVSAFFRLNIDDVKEFLLSKNIEMLSKKYVNCQEKILLKCLICKNVWKTKLNGIKHANHGCPLCAKIIVAQKRRHSFEYVKSFCLQRNIEVISERYVSSNSKLKFRCLECSYVWEGKFNAIKQGSGCAKCAGNAKLSYDFVKEFCQNKNINLLSKEYKNARSKLKFECLICKHIWKTTYDSIRRGSGCPCCWQHRRKNFTIDLSKYKKIKISSKFL